METIYWIQRLGSLSTVSTAVAVISGCTLVLFVGLIVLAGEYDDFEEVPQKIISYLKKLFFTLVVSTLMAIFVPSEKDLYVIYGVGGTIDYLKSNDTAKQLPDKAIKALDAWIDTINDKDKD